MLATNKISSSFASINNSNILYININIVIGSNNSDIVFLIFSSLNFIVNI